MPTGAVGRAAGSGSGEDWGSGEGMPGGSSPFQVGVLFLLADKCEINVDMYEHAWGWGPGGGTSSHKKGS